MKPVIVPRPETELTRRAAQVRLQSEELAADGIVITRSGPTSNGFVIEYLAADFERADRLLHRRYGEFAVIRYRGASNHIFCKRPFGSWAAEEDRLLLCLPTGSRRAAPQA